MPSELPQFIHLRVHSAYSLLEGALPLDALVETCRDRNMPALAVTDRNNLYGALEFAEAAAEQGIQPIIGATLHIVETSGDEKPDEADGAVALLAKNEAGYRNLVGLVSLAHLESACGRHPAVAMAHLANHSEGLICLTGGTDGPVDAALAQGQVSKAKGILTELSKIFSDNLYVELQRYGGQNGAHESALIDHAYTLEIPLVATNQVYFADFNDYEAHDALICIAEGTYIDEAERRRVTSDHWLKSAEDMCALFADLPEALENTVEIAQRCAFRPTVQEPFLPVFVAEDETEALRREAEAGLAARLARIPLAAPEEDYKERLNFELEVIAATGFAGYFLIVADFVKWAKSQHIAVGPGRGSGAGSVVAWALTITDLDPLRFNLLFERFLNPDRISMPDFDIDFCQSRRDEVIAYVREKYGTERVAQIITFGKLQARAVLRDVGRVLQMPYGQVDRLCKMVPNNPADPTNLADAIAGDARLQEAGKKEDGVDKLFEISLKLEGLYRHASTHAAGVVIGDRPLQELVPLTYDPKSEMRVTQFNMKWVEKAGLVKFDFLGLKTLTVLEQALDLLRRDGHALELDDIPLDDRDTFELLGAGDTVGVFQLESGGMRDALRRMKPDAFEDIIALVALYRPGPMDNIPRFIACKKGEEEPDYLYPKLLTPILEETYGVIIYQEQVMQIAQTLSGYSLAEADVLRRAMGKKIQSEMTAQKARFIEGAVANEVDATTAEHIFTQVDRFAGYGFNKSHAAAYALIAYQTAYLKANHPVAFYAASMSLDYERTDKLHVFRQDAAAHGVEIHPPDINRSDAAFSVADGNIVYALSAIRNVGAQAMRDVAAERAENGLYKDIFDFARRTGDTGLNRRMLENLIAAGAFDALEADRARLMAACDILLAESATSRADRETHQQNLFGGTPQAVADTLPEAEKAWTATERLAHEFGALGFYLSGHPLDDYEAALARAQIVSADAFQKGDKSEAMLAGIVISIDQRKSRRGNAFAFLTLSDRSGQFEVMAFSDAVSYTHLTLPTNREV